jgi:DNA adenine methylase
MRRAFSIFKNAHTRAKHFSRFNWEKRRILTNNPRRRRKQRKEVTQAVPRRVKPAISWPGGKSRLLEKILPLIPEHVCYCEPFAGGLAVLLAKKRSDVEVVNDINGDLVTFYRCVRFHQEPLLTELEFVLNSRQEFNDFVEQEGLTDIQRAARWYFRNKLGFGGDDMEHFGTSAVSGHSSRAARMETIRALSYRLDRVTVELLDWKKCVLRYDRRGTFFFFDPPYTGCKLSSYAAWTETDVQALRDTLAQVKGSWLVSLNDTSAIRQIFTGCRIRSVERVRGIDNTRGTKTYKELLITPK